MSDHTSNTVGVDISKAHLDAHALPSGRAARFSNDAAGFKKLAAWAGPAECVVYESTGPWHRALEEALAGELPLSRVNAMRARRFAQALGQEAKTDAVDAWVLARMGAAMELRRVEPSTPTRRDLDELQTARDGLVRDRTAALNRRHQARHPLMKRQLGAHGKADQGLGRRDRQADRRRRGAVASGRGADLDTGYRRITAAGLLTEMPELGRIDGKAAASLAGLAPVTRESGAWKGRSFIGGGRSRPRRMLYMAAVSAITHNPDLARKYRELRERGKPPKVALVAVMRKLVVLANALLAQDREWTPQPVGASA